ncbi:MAG: hypothetical protein IJX90_09105 [Blautia sp.]|nr:hypothetical protein [Blautia sp.]
MNRYEWEGYRRGEAFPYCDGMVYSYNETDARKKIEAEFAERGEALPDEIRILGGDFVGCEAARWTKSSQKQEGDSHVDR